MDSISTSYSFLFETTINHAEIVAIKDGFQSIQDNLASLHQFDQITIFTDSLFCYQLLSPNGYPNCDCIMMS